MARTFADVEHEAFLKGELREFVGSGTIEIVVAHPNFIGGDSRRDPAPHLQYRLKGKRISRERAADLFIAWANSHDRLAARAGR